MNKKLLLLIAAVFVLGLAWAGWKYFQNRGSNGEGTSTPGGDESTAGSTECPVGGYWNAGGVEYRITGHENHTLGGSSQRLCCGTWESTADNEKMKYCYSEDSYVAWVANAETGGDYMKSMESYKQGDQSCFKLYDTSENVVAESCQ